MLDLAPSHSRGTGRGPAAGELCVHAAALSSPDQLGQLPSQHKGPSMPSGGAGREGLWRVSQPYQPGPCAGVHGVTRGPGTQAPPGHSGVWGL